MHLAPARSQIDTVTPTMHALVSRTSAARPLLLLLGHLLCCRLINADPPLPRATRLSDSLVRSHHLIHLLNHHPQARILLVEPVDGTIDILSGDHLALSLCSDVSGLEDEPNGGLGDALPDGFPGAVRNVELALALRHQQGLDGIERHHTVRRDLALARVLAIVRADTDQGGIDDGFLPGKSRTTLVLL
jgi:hypothetical protein